MAGTSQLSRPKGLTQLLREFASLCAAGLMALALIIGIATQAPALAADPVYPALTDRVVDGAGIIPADVQTSLIQKTHPGGPTNPRCNVPLSMG